MKDFKIIKTLCGAVEKEFTKKQQHYYTALYQKRCKKGCFILTIDEARDVAINDSLLGMYTLIWKSDWEFEYNLGYCIHNRHIYTHSDLHEIIDDMFRFIKSVQHTANIL